MYKDRILKLLRASRPAFSPAKSWPRRWASRGPWSGSISRSLEAGGVRDRGRAVPGLPDHVVAGSVRLDDIKSGLRTKIDREGASTFFPRLASTNTVAMEMASQGAPEGTVVIAETQTAGKGRLGRKWISPEGKPVSERHLQAGVPVHKAPLITLMGAVAAAPRSGRPAVCRRASNGRTISCCQAKRRRVC